jgi:predicted P-loop ATPase
MIAPTTADYAASYINQFKFALVPLPPRTKRPLTENWGNDVITDAAQARAYYEKHPDWNIGAALGPSRLCSFDVDDINATRQIFEEFGWDLDALRDNYPTIQGSPDGFRVMFRVPEGMALPYHSLTWPKPDGQTGNFTVWEIRAAVEKQRQDVLPPSIHPVTQQPYIWLTRPKPADGFPEPPDFLLKMWEHWEALKPQFKAVCPWTPKRTAPAPRQPSQPHTGESVIDAYNAANDIEAMLARYGYKRQGKRYLSPHSGTGLPGVIVWPEANKCFIHHASDPLCSDESGQPVGPFDLFAYYDHGGDMKKAAKDAAEQLGMKRQAPSQQVAIHRAPASIIDQDTGEIIEPANDNAVLDLAPLPYVGSRGKPLATIENLHEICQRLDVTIRYDVIRKDDEIMIPGVNFSVDNKANASLAWLSSQCAKFNYPTGQIGDFVTFLADQNLYNPAINYVTSEPWDGVSRAQAFYNTVKAKGQDQTLKETLMKRWMISAIAAAFRADGVSAHGVLVLQGDQYLGKTKWFKSLVPDSTRLAQDGWILRPDDKDSVKQACSFWLVELGELDATFRKSDIAALKSFLTRDRDVLRRAYARRESEYGRRTVFFASVNPREFLHDITGNRRYWTIECEHIDHSHNLNMQQVWAEFHQMYVAGETWFLQPDEMAKLNEANTEFEVRDPIEDRLMSRLDWQAPNAIWRWMTVLDVLIEVGIERPERNQLNTAGHIIRKLNNGAAKKTHGVRRVLVPPKTGDQDQPF